MAKQEKRQTVIKRTTPAQRQLSGRELWVLGALACAAVAVLVTVDLFAAGAGAAGRVRPGDIADRSYKAPADLVLVDQAATEKHRTEAEQQAPVVYDFDERWGQNLRERIVSAFAAARTAAARPEGEGEDAPSPRDVLIEALEPSGEPSEASVALLATRQFADDDERALLRVLRPVLVRRIVDDPDEFARQAERRPVVVRELASDRERVLEAVDNVIGPKPARGLVADEANKVLAERPFAERKAILDLAESLVAPNLSFNLRATEDRRLAAVDGVKDVTIALRKGEIIVRDGDPVTEVHIQILAGIRDQYQTRRRLTTSLGLALLAFLMLMAVWRFAKGVPRFPRTAKDAGFLLSLLVMTVFGTKIGMFVAEALATNLRLEPWLGAEAGPLYYGIPIAAAAMLVRIVHTAETAALFAMVVAPISGLQVGAEVSYACYVLVGSLVAAAGASKVTQRGTLLRAGAKVGLANMAVVVALLLLEESLALSAALIALGGAFFSGCFAGGLVSALAPVVESTFGYTTDVKLLELANREQPLLRELEIRAPGTYHHSMMVGHLAEKAAEAIGANALLAKVGGYYHDIGKMRRPHFFVENVTVHQGENRHEKLSPSMSARIIQAHVKDGLELGRQHKLVAGIMQSIGEHHGTSIIRFFYEKAKELIDPEKGEFVEEHEYRYPGPRPQTRESGILMLADSVEAASRTLVDTSVARIQQLVQRTISNYFRDGQLDECSLTLRDLHAIARSFIDTLSAIRHERIDYPEATDAEGRKVDRADEGEDEGVVERLEPRKKDRQEGVPEKREDDLRRLGLS